MKYFRTMWLSLFIFGCFTNVAATDGPLRKLDPRETCHLIEGTFDSRICLDGEPGQKCPDGYVPPADNGIDPDSLMCLGTCCLNKQCLQPGSFKIENTCQESCADPYQDDPDGLICNGGMKCCVAIKCENSGAKVKGKCTPKGQPCEAGKKETQFGMNGDDVVGMVCDNGQVCCVPEDKIAAPPGSGNNTPGYDVPPKE